jgi:hypothetical protein
MAAIEGIREAIEGRREANEGIREAKKALRYAIKLLLSIVRNDENEKKKQLMKKK